MRTTKLRLVYSSDEKQTESLKVRNLTHSEKTPVIPLLLQNDNNNQPDAENIQSLVADKNSPASKLLDVYLFDGHFDYALPSIANYRCLFNHYYFLTIADFERIDFVKFAAAKAKPDWNRRTIEKNLQLLCAFSVWLCNMGFTTRKHRHKRTRKPIQRDLPTTEEISLIFDSLKIAYHEAGGFHRRALHQRYLVTRILFETGARISEATAIYLEDVRIAGDKYFILIRGTKTEAAERTCQISTQLFDELKEFRNIYDLRGRLFSSANGNILDGNDYGKKLRKHCAKIGISCKIHPHLFRYLYIIESIKSGKDPFEIMIRLGHSDVTMTLYYFRQVRRLYPDLDLTESISLLERKKSLNVHIFNTKGKQK
jgi:integrase